MAASARSSIAVSQATRTRRAGWARIDLLPYLLIAPAVLMVALVTVYPALYALGISTTDANLLRLASSKAVGLANYIKAWDDEIFTQALWQTVRWVVVNAAGQMLLALPVALFLNTAFRGRGLVRDLLLRLGVISESVAWIGEPLPAFGVISTATIWSGFPFFAVTLLAALQVIPEDLYEAARIDGASAWQRFTKVTVPLLTPTILLLLLLRTIWLAHSVDLIFLMSNGGPGYNNYTVALYSFILTWNQLQLGYPSALVIMLSIVILIASVLYIRSIERSREWM